MQSLNLGLIGAGKWGRNYLRTIAGLSECRVSMVATRSGSSTEMLPSGCKVVSDWREVVSSPRIDGIIVATPPSLHAEIALAAIAEQKPILVEKPLALSVGDGERIRSAFSDRSNVFMVDHIHLYHPAFRALQHLASEFGPIRQISSAAGNMGPYRKDVSVLWDWAPHDFAMSLSLVAGPARPIHAVGSATKSQDGQIGEELCVDVELGAGVRHKMRLSNGKPRHRRFSVEFENDVLVYQDQGDDLLVRFHKTRNGSDTGRRVGVRYEPPLERVLVEFAAAIRRDDRNIASLDLALSVIRLIEETDAMLTVSSMLDS